MHDKNYLFRNWKSEISFLANLLFLVQFFIQIYKVAAVKPDGFKKGKHIDRIPADRRIDFKYFPFLVSLE